MMVKNKRRRLSAVVSVGEEECTITNAYENKINIIIILPINYDDLLYETDSYDSIEFNNLITY